MQFAHPLDSVGIIIDIFAQVYPKVGVVPVGIVTLVHLSVPTLGTTARGVALESQSHIVDDGGLAILGKCQ